MSYQTIIGLEIHTELKTKSKMFCGCNNDADGHKPNTLVCPICLGHPGTLPVPNKQAIEFVLTTGLAMNAQINFKTKFDRKNYFYPDLPKGYQISQYDQPLVYGGGLEVEDTYIAITRIHLEEDTGKSFHPQNSQETLIDFNRAGTPLMELVTEPVIPNASVAKKFCQKYQQLLRYLDISNADMEKGEMRCEANISVQTKGSFKHEGGVIKPKGKKKLNNKVEIKNINSFRALEKAINYEIERQTNLLNQNEEIKAETRGWNDKEQKTVSQRIKESSADYRYFPEPDIPPIEIDGEWLARLKTSLPEMPDNKLKRFKQEYGLKTSVAELLVHDKQLANWSEQVISELNAWVEANGDEANRQDKKIAEIAANWISSELLKYFKERNETVKDLKMTAENFAELICLVYQNKINSSAGQTILEFMYNQGGDPSEIMNKMGLKQIDDTESLKKAITKIIAANPQPVNDYKKGKHNVIQFLLGKIMAETKGKANPKIAKNMLEKMLS